MKNKIIIISTTTFFTFLIFNLSLNHNLWNIIWGGLSIPAYVPFSDLIAHIHFYECFKSGIDIFSEKCPEFLYAPGGLISTHPPIWIDIVKFFHLYKNINFNIFVIASYFIYFYLFFNLFSIFKSNQSKIFLIIFLLSTTNFILLERFSTDLLIFIFTSLIIFFRLNIIKLLLIFIGTILKFYPFFLLMIFIKDKKFFFISTLILILFLYFFYFDEISSTNSNLIEIAYFTAYGSRTMFKALYFLSENYNSIINQDNINLFRNIFISLIVTYSILLVLLGYFYSQSKSSNILSEFEQLFLIGSSIYVGTFIFAANADYRLIFLIFTIPYILERKNNLSKYTLNFCIIVSINSFLFQFGEPLSINFYMRAIFIFGCKFIILSLFLIYIGNILKKLNFLKIN